MSEYCNYIDDVLASEYEQVSCLKNSEEINIVLYRHKQSSKKIVYIASSNRNDHIFRALLNKSHPCLPRILGVCSCEDNLVILESFIEGVSLEDKLKDKLPDTKTAIRYVLDICDALEFLHSLNIIHRDIKPQNIMIDENDKAVLIDLQAARNIADKQKKDTVNLGTVGYAAPEQYGVHQSIPPTDIYALGVLLNEMLTGAHPSINTPPGKLGRIIKKCTETQIYKRYQTVSSLSKDLKKYTKFH